MTLDISQLLCMVFVDMEQSGGRESRHCCFVKWQLPMVLIVVCKQDKLLMRFDLRPQVPA